MNENIVEILSENYLRTTEDLKFNIDTWNKGSNNILFITGLSGSGKSTLANQITKEKDAAKFEIDSLWYNFNSIPKKFNFNVIKLIRDKFPEIDKIYEKFKDSKDGLANGHITSADWKVISRPEVFKFIIEEMHKRKDILFIIEGIQLMNEFKFYFEDNRKVPLIIKQTSMFKSIYQRFKRNNGGVKVNWKLELSNEFLNLVSFYLDDEKRKKTFIKNTKK